MSSNKKETNFIVITGPTATGKTKVAVNIASQYNGEIISADSRQIYKGMDIGTGKDLNEYIITPSMVLNKFPNIPMQIPFYEKEICFLIQFFGNNWRGWWKWKK